MSAAHPRRFAQPDLLKTIRQDHLITFLKKYEDYLIDRAFGFELNEAGALDFETLAWVLMSPDEAMPVALVEALFFIQEMSDTAHFERLSEQASANGVAVHEDATPADLALALWLHEPELLKRAHAEALVLRPQLFLTFQSQQSAPEAFELPSAQTITAMERAMDAWFYENKRGTGCRILPVSAEREDKTYFLIRHGMPFKREGRIEAGQSSTIFYRPEFHDVLIYDQAHNELAVFNTSGARTERQMYLDVFSQHLFGQPGYFPGEDRYTLQPLIDRGVDALACTDIDGLEAVTLVEIELQYHGPYNERHSQRANDIFASLAARGQSLPSHGTLVAASFAVKFEQAKRPRMLKLRIPNGANFDRKEDAHLIEHWLRKRGFVNGCHNEGRCPIDQAPIDQERHESPAPLA